MIDIRSLSVKVGDLVIPAWRRLVAALQTLQVQPGVGVLITRTPRGSIINARAWLMGFRGSWDIGAPTKKGVRVGYGYLNGKLVPNTGPEAKPIPWSEMKYSDTGHSWLMLEVPVTAGGFAEVEKAKLVQANSPHFAAGAVGRTPIAVAYRGSAGTGFGQMHRIAYFDFQHRYNAGSQRHFFFV